MSGYYQNSAGLITSGMVTYCLIHPRTWHCHPHAYNHYKHCYYTSNIFHHSNITNKINSINKSLPHIHQGITTASLTLRVYSTYPDSSRLLLSLCWFSSIPPSIGHTYIAYGYICSMNYFLSFLPFFLSSLLLPYTLLYKCFLVALYQTAE